MTDLPWHQRCGLDLSIDRFDGGVDSSLIPPLNPKHDPWLHD